MEAVPQTADGVVQQVVRRAVAGAPDRTEQLLVADDAAVRAA